MPIISVNKGDCPKCSGKNSFGNILVRNNILLQGCKICDYRPNIELPLLNRELLYLDQSFFSHAFRKNEKKFVIALQQISNLIDLQLLACPFSDFHLDETRLWSHDDKNKLLRFIKENARWKKFIFPHEVKMIQLVNCFHEFMCSSDLDTKYNYDRSEVIKGLNDWYNYHVVTINDFQDHIEPLKYYKAIAINKLLMILEDWRRDETSFSDDYDAEIKGLVDGLIQIYLKYLESGGDFLNAPLDSDLIETLMHYDSKTLSVEDRFTRILTFFSSPYFKKVPWVDISCRIYAVFRKNIKAGQFMNLERSKNKLSGIFFDVNFISIYLPYCDSIFIDSAMHRRLLDKEADILNHLNTKVFSVINWTAFEIYLSSIKSRMSPELERNINLVYSSNS